MVTVTLEEAEWQFLVTVLRSAPTILQSLAVAGKALPEPVRLPIDDEMLANVRQLAERISAQTHS